MPLTDSLIILNVLFSLNISMQPHIILRLLGDLEIRTALCKNSHFRHVPLAVNERDNQEE